MWERGVRDSGPGRRHAARWVTVVVVLACLVTLTALAGRPAGQPALGLGSGTASSDAAAEVADGDDVEEPSPGEATAAPERPDTVPGDTGRGYALDGGDPETFPDEPTGLAFLTLDDPLSLATEEFGPPQEQQPDINGATANTWTLPGDARFTAVAAGEAADDPLVGLIVEVPASSPVRVAAYEGVVVGRSTPAQVAEAWGAGYDRSQGAGEDYVIRYTLCQGGWPVVVKFDQPETAGWDDAPVTRVLIAYADDDPGSCAPS